MRRPTFRRTLRLETLESRELLTAGGPSADAQYMLSMINLARTNPAEAAQKFTNNLDPDVLATLNYYHVDLNQVRNEIASSPVRPPVGWSDTLARAANGMALDQATNGFQSHTGSDGSTLDQRLDRVGYTNRVSEGENTYAYSKSVDHAMEAFLIDWGVSSDGHRNNLLQPNATPDQFYREVGIGIVPATNPNVGPLVITQDFGNQAGSKAELVGVAYNDNAHTGIYAEGEGVGNVEVDATNNQTGATASTLTWDNGGGYQLSLDPGAYTVTAKLNGQVLQTNQVSIGNQNVEVDYNLTALQGSGSSGSSSTGGTASSAPVVSQSNLSGTPDTHTSFSSSWTSWTANSAN
jgi:uncharacterized protein YkwD